MSVENTKNISVTKEQAFEVIVCCCCISVRSTLCASSLEALADCSVIETEMETVSSEMEVTAGLIQKLVNENAIRKLDQYDY